MKKSVRVQVRELLPSDFSQWRAAYLSMLPSQSPFDRTPPPGLIPTQDMFRKIVSRQMSQALLGACFEYAVFDLDTGELVGATDLKRVAPVGSALLGYSIFNRHWGRGLGAAAVTYTIEIAFGEKRFDALIIEIETGNERSLRLARSAGFMPESESVGRTAYRLTRQAWRESHSSPLRAR
jgi:RimJ/RimL family protein N-acetyltransferase